MTKIWIMDYDSDIDDWSRSSPNSKMHKEMIISIYPDKQKYRIYQCEGNRIDIKYEVIEVELHRIWKRE